MGSPSLPPLPHEKLLLAQIGSIRVPSLHLIGAQDPIRERSRRLSQTFEGGACHEMSYAAHALPAVSTGH